MTFRQNLSRRKREPMGLRTQFHYRSQTYRQWVAGMPCTIAGINGHVCIPNVVCAHMRLGTDGWLSEKPSDWFGYPLCDDMKGNGAHPEQHNIGEPEFFRRYGIKEPLLIPARIWWLPTNRHRLKYEANPLVCTAVPPARPGTISSIKDTP